MREDPLLAIKRQEQLAYQAMMNNPALKRQVKAIKEKKEGTKEERKEKKRREKEVRVYTNGNDRTPSNSLRVLSPGSQTR